MWSARPKPRGYPRDELVDAALSSTVVWFAMVLIDRRTRWKRRDRGSGRIDVQGGVGCEIGLRVGRRSVARPGTRGQWESGVLRRPAGISIQRNQFGGQRHRFPAL